MVFLTQAAYLSDCVRVLAVWKEDGSPFEWHTIPFFLKRYTKLYCLLATLFIGIVRFSRIILSFQS